LNRLFGSFFPVFAGGFGEQNKKIHK
jgi:hypothetical protein